MLKEKDVKFLSKVSVYPALGCSCIPSEKRKRIEMTGALSQHEGELKGLIELTALLNRKKRPIARLRSRLHTSSYAPYPHVRHPF